MHKTELIGNLGGDPQARKVQGHFVANFPVGVTEKWKDSEGKTQTRTVWYRVAAWDRLGEICAEHLAKGRKVYVEGRLDADPDTGGPKVWSRSDGRPGTAFDLRANRVVFLAGGTKVEMNGQPTEKD